MLTEEDVADVMTQLQDWSRYPDRASDGIRILAEAGFTKAQIIALAWVFADRLSLTPRIR